MRDAEALATTAIILAFLFFAALLFFVAGSQVGMSTERGRWERGEKTVRSGHADIR